MDTFTVDDKLPAGDMYDPLWDKAKSILQDSIATKTMVLEQQLGTILQMARIIASSLENGGKILACGNGGSAADAQHLAAEMLVRLRPDVDREGIPAIALAMDSSSLTAASNDYSFDMYYERVTRTLGERGDVLVGISTSGESQNVIRALKAAHEMGLVTLGLLGTNGGSALSECQVALVAPSDVTGRIQEVHVTVIHIVMELVEDMLLASGYVTRE